MKRVFFALSAVLFALPQAVQALTVTAVEHIYNNETLDPFSRDLERTRTDSLGTDLTTASDGVVITDNAVNGCFGVLSSCNVVYRHDLRWLNPAPDSFLSATLAVDGWLFYGGDDRVYAEGIDLGVLNAGVATTTVFGPLSDAIVLNALFADGFLNIIVNKNENAVWGDGRNLLSVIGSTLTLQYQAVPEPATLVLIGLGLAGSVVRRRRRA